MHTTSAVAAAAATVTNVWRGQRLRIASTATIATPITVSTAQ